MGGGIGRVGEGWNGCAKREVVRMGGQIGRGVRVGVGGQIRGGEVGCSNRERGEGWSGWANRW